MLKELYKFARRIGVFPSERLLPTDCDEFKREISGALDEKAKLGKVARVACPIETARAVVHCEALSELRKVMTRTYCFTGVRPGELHGLRVDDYRNECGVWILDVRQQLTLDRTGYPGGLTAPKTRWGRRKVPVHASLKLALDAWIASGWKSHVGREPTGEDFLFPDATGEDFLFPDATGEPFREARCKDFIDDVATAGCATSVKGVSLELYSLRHLFAGAAKRAGLSSEARDQLLGHRPHDTKALHYEDEDLPLLAAEIAKLPWMLDEHAPKPPRAPDTPATPPPSTTKSALRQSHSAWSQNSRSNSYEPQKSGPGSGPGESTRVMTRTRFQ